MSQKKSDYILGLDIGTNSCGWAVADKKNALLKLRGKTAIGSHLFEEGHSAADRRGFRTTRRRLKRRKWRLGLLEEIFAESMAEVDPAFFVRLHQSWVSPLDKDRQKYAAIVFPTAKEDAKFYQKYPTIYHLRQALMTENRKFDLREIFLAMHHIVKYRGNFLQDTPVKNFEASKIDVVSVLNSINEAFNNKADEDCEKLELNLKNAHAVEEVIKGKDPDKTTYKKDKVKKIALLLPASTDKNAKNVSKQIANAIMGYKTQFETILAKEIDKSDKVRWEFKLSDADADEKLDALLPELDEDDQTIIVEIKKLFSSITLSTIVDEGKSLSASMVNKYNQHRCDYKLLKIVIDGQADRQKAKTLRLGYDLYVNNRHGHLLEAKAKFGQDGALTKEDFYKVVKENLDDSKAASQILQEIETDSFMPKQRTNSNGVIPFQLHQIELDKIIANQSQYYPFLATENPVEEHRKQAPYKLDELVRFKVPYYVGPMVTVQDQEKTSGKNFAWMVRKEPGQITPWNFEQKIDRQESANRFIKRMTIKDTYLLGEDVLPANSLLYQRFEVLNELNNLRINGKKISVSLKQDIFNNLFKNKRTVTTRALITYIKQHENIMIVKIDGLADPTKFNSSLSSYYHLKGLKVFSDQLEDPKYSSDFEKIIEYSSIFEDNKIFQEKLHEISWLSQDQFKALSNWRLQGWGRLSSKLLVGLRDQNDQNVMEQLWDSQKNFAKIITEPDFKSAIAQENQQITKENGVEEILADAYTSPANKKAIRQVVKVVEDVVKAAGAAPAQFTIEYTREPQKNPKLSQIRGSQLLKIYQDADSELIDQSLTDALKDAIKNKKLVKDKYFLYFMQAGRDAYTGEKIDVDELSSSSKYDIDHILPQAFIKDDSLDNRVLTAKAINAEKADDVPYKRFGNDVVADLNIKINELWRQWQAIGLISKYKLNNLILDPDKLSKYQKEGFINRQLVETSQIIKLVSVILQNKYPDSEIITVRARDNSALRQRLNLYKSREVNDYHHAIDAYLSIVCGNFLYQVYPKYRPFFVYGKYKKFSEDPQLQREAISNFKGFNFLWPLLQKDNSERKAPEKILENNSDRVVFLKHPDIFDRLCKAYNYKYMLVSRETTTENSGLFNMTVYPRQERDRKKTRKLIPKGKNLDPTIYGGYSGNANAYMVIVKIEKTKGDIYRVVGVPMRFLARLQQAKKQGKYNHELHKILESLIMLDKSGKPKRGLKGFRIIKDHVHFKQVVVDGDKKFMLYSASYQVNAKQLTLSQETMKIVTDNMNQKEDNEDQLLVNAYDEILSKVDLYLPLFDTNNFRLGLHNGRTKFINLTVKDKKHTITNILNGLHDNLMASDLKNLGIKTPFGVMQTAAGVVLSSNAVLIFQSPTGLFEKRIKITNL